VKLWSRLLLLTLAWLALTGETSVADAAFGAVVAWSALQLTGKQPASFGWRRVPAAVHLGVFFLWELIVANVKVAAVVIQPGRLLRSGIVAVPLEVTSDSQISLLANLITLTPGTLSLDVSTDRKVLYVHFLQMGSPEAARRELKEGFEKRVLAVLA